MNKTLSIYIFNTGAGDNILIEFPNKAFGIIDLNYQVNLKQNEPPAITYLRNLPKSQRINILFLCITHYDNDHILGIEDYINFVKEKNVKVKDLWLAGSNDRSFFFELFKKRLAEKRLNIEEREIIRRKNLTPKYKKYNQNVKKLFDYTLTIKPENILHIYDIKDIDVSITDDVSCFSLAPLKKHVDKFEKLNFEALVDSLVKESEVELSTNNNLISSIIFFKSNLIQWAFGGDSPKVVWKDSIKYNKTRTKKILDSDFVKVSHHGSKGSSSKVIWDTLIANKNEAIFAITAGKKNKHPHKKTVTDIKKSCENFHCVYNILSTNACAKCLAKYNDVKLSLTYSSLSEEEKKMLETRTEDFYNPPSDNVLLPFGSGLLGYKIEYNLLTTEKKITILKDDEMPIPDISCSHKSGCKLENL